MFFLQLFCSSFECLASEATIAFCFVLQKKVPRAISKSTVPQSSACKSQVLSSVLVQSRVCVLECFSSPGHHKGRCGAVEVECSPMQMRAKAKELATLIRDAPMVVAHTGAGLSTAAGKGGIIFAGLGCSQFVVARSRLENDFLRVLFFGTVL